MDFTVVLGVDADHVPHLLAVWENWRRYKPSLFENQFVIFYDVDSMRPSLLDDVARTLSLSTRSNVSLVPWSVDGGFRDYGDKWTNAQRQKMLAGFVYTASEYVKTPYWLKLDLDAVAIGQDDWIDESWFDDSPAIISHPWGYTKPPNQMLELDDWVRRNHWSLPGLRESPPLNLIPEPGSSLVKHKRIISWCAFFNTAFTGMCAKAAEELCGRGRLPVPSQDGYMWYMATRGGYGVRRENMKARGWQHCANLRRVQEEIRKLNELTHAE